MTSHDISGYGYVNAQETCAHEYLWPQVARLLGGLDLPAGRRRLFEVGCGNGHTAARLTERGWEVVGVDPSVEGIRIARVAHPSLRLDEGSCYDDLAGKYGRFPVVLGLEVVEHVYEPRKFAKCVYDLCEDGGRVIISTPYHGYWKNLAMAITGKLDAHFTALWDHGHIKFWSIRTLTHLLKEAGFQSVEFRRVGRIPPLAKSMIAVARR